MSAPPVNVGLGYLTIVPAGATPTPISVGVLQEVQLDYSSEKKMLYGEKQFAVASADVTAKLTGKAKFAQIDAALIGYILAGSTTATGKLSAVTENGVVATGAFTVSGSATWTGDLGVFNSSGTKLSRVASAPVAGVSYTVAAGVYTFNATDNGTTYTFRYTKSTAGSGSTISVLNSLTGLSTTFGLKLYNEPTKNATLTLAAEFSAVVFPKLSLPFKTDFLVQDIDFEILDPGTGIVGLIAQG